MELKKTLLLHSCCAPCSTVAIERLNDEFDITVYYYNPNIYPTEEYLKRKNEQINFINNYNLKNETEIKFIDGDYNDKDFYEKIVGYENEPEMGIRCEKCIELRLETTASMAIKINADKFSTTLSISPYKDTETINKLGNKMADKYNIKFLENNFKEDDGYKKSIEISKDYSIYRQKYCGCKYSIRA
jgi:predicted adenine nucleotide alpha hydrolase (AANH) superfamily ATPase